ncbi:MAG: hypothetical protein OK442_07955 [Thaumarchaeota archaeon]|nr:hypothetical protein [Nitrososphaerota archaeon]
MVELVTVVVAVTVVVSTCVVVDVAVSVDAADVVVVVVEVEAAVVVSEAVIEVVEATLAVGEIPTTPQPARMVVAVATNSSAAKATLNLFKPATKLRKPRFHDKYLCPNARTNPHHNGRLRCGHAL